MARVQIRPHQIEIARQFEYVEFRGEDGMYSRAGDVVHLTIGQKHYILPNLKQGKTEEGFTVWYERYSVEEMFNRITVMKSVNLDRWMEVEEDTRTFEERMNDEWEREQFERGMY